MKFSNQKLSGLMICFYNTVGNYGWFFRQNSSGMTMALISTSISIRNGSQLCNVQKEGNKEGLWHVYFSQDF